MGVTMNKWIVALAAAALVGVMGCKDDGSFEERQKTSGEEVEAGEEHGDTAIDAADEADEWDESSAEDADED
jgi:hypothetical protein